MNGGFETRQARLSYRAARLILPTPTLQNWHKSKLFGMWLHFVSSDVLFSGSPILKAVPSNFVAHILRPVWDVFLVRAWQRCSHLVLTRGISRATQPQVNKYLIVNFWVLCDLDFVNFLYRGLSVFFFQFKRFRSNFLNFCMEILQKDNQT